MSRAVCIPFHRYHPHTTEHYRVWMNALLNGLAIWGKEFDKLYLIDDYWDFNFEELDRLNKLGIDYQIIKKQRDGHHWVQFKTAFPHIKEDYCLFLDNDVLIWKEGVVANWFKQAEAGKFVTAFDGSGGLSEQMHRAFINLPAGTHRMGSYYFILNQRQLEVAKQVDLAPIHYRPGTFISELKYTTVEGDWQDSFGALTIKLLGETDNLFVIDDDRASIYFEDTINKDPTTPKQLGYYHVRNGGHTTYLLSSKFGGDEAGYQHSLEITPRRELMRIMAWHYLCADHTHDDDIASILVDIRVSEEAWQDYLYEFKNYHGLFNSSFTWEDNEGKVWTV